MVNVEKTLELVKRGLEAVNKAEELKQRIEELISSGVKWYNRSDLKDSIEEFDLQVKDFASDLQTYITIGADFTSINDVEKKVEWVEDELESLKSTYNNVKKDENK